MKRNILFFCLFWGVLNILANPYSGFNNRCVIIGTAHDNTIILPINENLKIENLGEEIKLNISDNPQYIHLDELDYIGYIYFNSEETKVESFEEDVPGRWEIYDSKGALIKETFSEKPDLSGLQPGEIYIVKSARLTFKYLPAR